MIVYFSKLLLCYLTAGWFVNDFLTFEVYRSLLLRVIWGGIFIWNSESVDYSFLFLKWLLPCCGICSLFSDFLILKSAIVILTSFTVKSWHEYKGKVKNVLICAAIQYPLPHHCCVFSPISMLLKYQALCGMTLYYSNQIIYCQSTINHSMYNVCICFVKIKKKLK